MCWLVEQTPSQSEQSGWKQTLHPSDWTQLEKVGVLQQLAEQSNWGEQPLTLFVESCNGEWS